jgi:hypothetical protein
MHYLAKLQVKLSELYHSTLHSFRFLLSLKRGRVSSSFEWFTIYYDKVVIHDLSNISSSDALTLKFYGKPLYVSTDLHLLGTGVHRFASQIIRLGLPILAVSKDYLGFLLSFSPLYEGKLPPQSSGFSIMRAPGLETHHPSSYADSLCRIQVELAILADDHGLVPTRYEAVINVLENTIDYIEDEAALFNKLYPRRRKRGYDLYQHSDVCINPFTIGFISRLTMGGEASKSLLTVKNSADGGQA